MANRQTYSSKHNLASEFMQAHKRPLCANRSCNRPEFVWRVEIVFGGEAERQVLNDRHRAREAGEDGVEVFWLHGMAITVNMQTEANEGSRSQDGQELLL